MLTQKYEVMILMLKLDVIRVAELGSLSSGAKLAMKILSNAYFQFSRQMRRFCA